MENKNELLHDILQEAAPADFREALLAETLGQVRRQKSQRRRNRTMLATAACVALCFAIWKGSLPDPVSEPVTTTALVADPLILRSVALSPEMVVETDVRSVQQVVGAGTPIAIVETPQAEFLFKTISDEELLTLVADRPAILVRPTADRAELHFANPDDSSELFLP